MTRAVIIGAGPAGLTAAYELATRTGIEPIVLEKSEHMGGIARTVAYKGNRIDIGGHRFFSKSDRVMRWWLDILPLQGAAGAEVAISYQGKTAEVSAAQAGPDPDATDLVMLARKRKSRIYHGGKLFEYPITLNADTIRKLGMARCAGTGLSYLRSALFPIRPERNLEEFFINRFGRELYLTFFKSYTEKVWGAPCHEISAEWGAQRIKGLSITRVILHFLKGLRPSHGIAQKDTETSLIHQFLYPKLGPGQLWEEVARRVAARGGQVVTGASVDRVEALDRRVTAVEFVRAGRRERIEADYVFSTMPIPELVAALTAAVPEEVRRVAEGLVFRDFITVGVLAKRLKALEGGRPDGMIEDNWIYIQDSRAQAGRVQIFNNWSPYLVADPNTVWMGLEYFCNATDPLWRAADDALKSLAASELERIGFIDAGDFLDGVVIRMPKTYPAYFGTYPSFAKIREYLDPFENLFLIGRNGMHKYNNQDHSMLAAMTAVDNIIGGWQDKANIWGVNAEEEYHEAKSNAI